MDYLYHYTTVETLALILKNHTIRFTALDHVDDKQENLSEDIKDAGQVVYVSCWMQDTTEHIPMWREYASVDAGVRIGLKRNPFKPFDRLEFECNEIMSPQFCYGPLLIEMEYTDDHSKLYPQIFEPSDNGFTLNIDRIGRYKNPYWKFQKEWRYIIHLIPGNMFQSPEYSQMEFSIVANKIRKGERVQRFPYYDCIIDDEAYSRMQILLSPSMSEGNKTIVESLVEKYNPTADINESVLYGSV